MFYDIIGSEKNINFSGGKVIKDLMIKGTDQENDTSNVPLVTVLK